MTAPFGDLGDLPPGSSGGFDTLPPPDDPSLVIAPIGPLGDLPPFSSGGGGPGYDPYVRPPDLPGATGDPATPFNLSDVMALAPGLPPELAQILLDTWIETGSWQIALGRMRASDAYDQYFPGNRRDDGSLRYDESTYFAILEGFRNTVDDYGINPDLFATGYIHLMVGGVGLAEFRSRMDRLAERVIVQSDAMRAHFAAELGIGLSTESLIAAMMDPNINDALLNRQLTEAEIMTEASMRGFNADAFDERLFEFGFTRGTAGQLFSAAQDQLPVLDTLAERHLDPDSDFDLGEFVDAMAFGNRTQRLRIRRLFAAESALFSPQLGIAAGPSGALTGLTER